MDYAAAQDEPGNHVHAGRAPRDREGRSLLPRDGVGLADGLVRLGPSASVPRPQRSSAFSRTTRKTNHFAWPRDFKRDLRRRRTIHAPWMHRPSLDRGRSLKRLEGDSGVELPPVACKLCWTSASLLRVMRAESVLLIFESCLLLLSSKVREGIGGSMLTAV